MVIRAIRFLASRNGGDVRVGVLAGMYLDMQARVGDEGTRRMRVVVVLELVYGLAYQWVFVWIQVAAGIGACVLYGDAGQAGTADWGAGGTAAETPMWKYQLRECVKK